MHCGRDSRHSVVIPDLRLLDVCPVQYSYNDLGVFLCAKEVSGGKVRGCDSLSSLGRHDRWNPRQSKVFDLGA